MATLPHRRAPLMPLAGLAIVLIAAIGAFLISNRMASEDNAVNHATEIRVDIAELGRQIATQNAGYRGFLVRGLPAQRAEEAQARAAIARGYAELRRELVNQPTQRAAIVALEPLLRERFAAISRHMAQKAQGGTGLSDGAERERNRWLVAELGRRLDSISQEEQRLLIAREHHEQTLISWLSMALAGSVMLVVLVAYLTASDARQRYRALSEANRSARVSQATAATESAARLEAEAQLRQIQKIESIGQMTGGIAHDFNNMLAVIVGSLDLARRRLDQPQRAERHLADAMEGAARATTLVSRLLAFSRRQALAPTRIEINPFLTDLVELMRRTLGEAILIELQLDEDAWPGFADRVQLENALLNLGVNARDAMERGGTLTLHTANLRVTRREAAAFGDLAPGDYVEIAVIDTGTGMSDDVIARAFDPFFTTKPVGRGTGLGLSQVFGFVRQSGGHVTIESTAGVGSCVRLMLPRCREGRLVATGGVEADTPKGIAPGLRVLLAEDDDRVRRFSCDALAELGCIVQTAANGHDALEMLAGDATFTLLFTDVVMPGMSGPELAVAARALHSGLRILYTTGYARDEAETGAQVALDAPVLPKPYSVDDLAAKLREILSD
jgi:signal transduction histidine kinase